ncbi:MAG TPA: 3-phosphoshikimate 1-carboxyvinyltransferase [Candidatus Altiarchaeales archaeon]|nr:3-phosphoshikimate 1-carboxyvinyltransferase [Candidatus Altiarchaeales archaeon]
MNLIVKPVDWIEGTVKAPPSKSYTHRAIIIASLADGRSIIHEPLISGDTIASINACKSLGSGIEVKERKLTIDGNSGRPEPIESIINVQNSGTTIRFMASVSALCNRKVTLTGDESIQKRPIGPLLKALEQLGAQVSSSKGRPPVTVHGPMKGGKCTIKGDISSQFISSLLISLPLTERGGEILIEGKLKSRPYVEMTLEMLQRFGARIDSYINKFRIKGNQVYGGIEYTVEGDYSSSAFIMAAASLIDSKLRIENLCSESKQGDRKIVEILDKMGSEIRTGRNYVEIRGDGNLNGIEIDMSDIPDLVPIVAVLGSLANGKTLIKNVGHLRYKESDRLHSITTELRKIGADIRERKDYLEINGVKELKSAKLHGWNDHRIVMSLAVVALRANENVVIDSAESIGISFPEFIETMKALGCDISVG